MANNVEQAMALIDKAVQLANTEGIPGTKTAELNIARAQVAATLAMTYAFLSISEGDDEESDDDPGWDEELADELHRELGL